MALIFWHHTQIRLCTIQWKTVKWCFSLQLNKDNLIIKILISTSQFKFKQESMWVKPSKLQHGEMTSGDDANNHVVRTMTEHSKTVQLIILIHGECPKFLLLKSRIQPQVAKLVTGLNTLGFTFSYSVKSESNQLLIICPVLNNSTKKPDTFYLSILIVKF